MTCEHANHQSDSSVLEKFATLKIVELGSIKVLDFWTCTLRSKHQAVNCEVERPFGGFHKWGYPKMDGL